MANDLGDIFSNFGCFDESTDVQSLFEDLESFNTLPNSDCSPASGSSSPEYEMMSVGSPALSSASDHLYANNPVMTETVSEHDERSPSPGGSLSSEQENSSDLLLYLMNETGVTVSERKVTDSDSSELAQQHHQNRGRKRHSSDESEDANGNAGKTQDKNRKNAIAARENRQKKKRYIEGLENENKVLSSENAQLNKDNEQMKSRVSSLEAEVDYLKSVLYNQSALSGLLKKLGSTDVRLSSTFETRKQSQQKEIRPTSGGICLHVNGKDASLELCAQCGLMGGPQL